MDNCTGPASTKTLKDAREVRGSVLLREKRLPMRSENLKDVYAVKWSEDQPGLVEGKPLRLGAAQTVAEARDLGAVHFAIPHDDVLVVEDDDREGQLCFYVSEIEKVVASFRM